MTASETDLLHKVASAAERTRLVLRSVPDAKEMDIPGVWGELVVLMYSRIRSGFEAVCTLVSANHPEEGFALVRSMLTDSLTLMEFASRPDDRKALALRWYSDSASHLEHLGMTAAEVGLPRAEDWKEAVAIERMSIQNAMKKHSIKSLSPRFSGDKELARKHERLQRYFDYRVYSGLIHRPDLAQKIGRRQVQEGVVQIYLRKSDPGWKAIALASAMDSALFAHKAIGSMIKSLRTSPAETDTLLAELDDLFPD